MCPLTLPETERGRVYPGEPGGAHQPQSHFPAPSSAPGAVGEAREQLIQELLDTNTAAVPGKAQGHILHPPAEPGQAPLHPEREEPEPCKSFFIQRRAGRELGRDLCLWTETCGI